MTAQSVQPRSSRATSTVSASPARPPSITGASRGIGLAIAARIVHEGGRVVVTARKPEGLADAIAALGGPDVAIPVAGRADDPDHQAEALERVVREFGRLDVLVNNTGINPGLRTAHPDRRGCGPQDHGRQRAGRAVVDPAAPSTSGLGANGHGAVVNIASVAGLHPSPGIGYYGVSKSALIGLTMQLAAELAPRVRVNAVAPAVVKTRFAAALYEKDEAKAASAYPLGRLGEPEDVAAAAAFLASGDAAWLTGQTLVIDGGLSLRASL